MEQPPPAYDDGSAKASAPLDLGSISVEHRQPTPEEQLEKLKAVAAKYELAGGAIAKLRKLSSYDIVVVADDSGSMRAPAHEVPRKMVF